MEAGGGLHLPVAPRIPTSLPFPGLQLPSSLSILPPGPPAITADTKPIRAGYRLHYHFTFFVRNPKTRERERDSERVKERERVSGQRAPGISTDDALARQILRALNAGVGGRVVDARFFSLSPWKSFERGWKMMLDSWTV